MEEEFHVCLSDQLLFLFFTMCNGVTESVAKHGKLSLPFWKKV